MMPKVGQDLDWEGACGQGQSLWLWGGGLSPPGAGERWRLMLLPLGVEKKTLPSTRPLPGTPRASCHARGSSKWEL